MQNNQEISQINNLQIFKLKNQEFCLNHTACFLDKSNNFLYNKYSSSQKYYYSKLITDLVQDQQTPEAIQYKDLELYDQEDNLLKRFYHIDEYKGKIELLTEYYKFHQDVPRIFMMPISKTAHNYYDKMRRINYIRITKMLQGYSQMEKIKIHDTDTSLSQKSSIMGSLVKILNTDLQDNEGLYRTKKRITPKNDKNSLNNSSTVIYLNNVLKNIFNTETSELEFSNITQKGKIKMNDALSNCRQKTESFEKIVKENFQKKFMKKKQNKVKNIKNQILKKMSQKEQTCKLNKKKSKNFQNCYKKDNTQLKKRNKHILNSFQKSVKKSDHSKQKPIQNLHINNLNININFSNQQNKKIQKQQLQAKIIQHKKKETKKCSSLKVKKQKVVNSLDKTKSKNDFLKYDKVKIPNLLDQKSLEKLLLQKNKILNNKNSERLFRKKKKNQSHKIIYDTQAKDKISQSRKTKDKSLKLRLTSKKKSVIEMKKSPHLKKQHKILSHDFTKKNKNFFSKFGKNITPDIKKSLIKNILHLKENKKGSPQNLTNLQRRVSKKQNFMTFGSGLSQNIQKQIGIKNQFQTINYLHLFNQKYNDSNQSNIKFNLKEKMFLQNPKINLNILAKNTKHNRERIKSDFLFKTFKSNK